MPDVLDQLDVLVPAPGEVRVEPGWASVRHRVRRARRRRQGLAGAAGVGLLVVGLVLGRATDRDDTAEVITTPPAEEGLALEPGWNVLPTLPIAPRVNPAITELADGDVFLWGGYTPDAAGVQLFDGAVLDAQTGEWEVLPAAPEVIPDEARAVTAGDEVVVMPSGGTTPFVPVVYDVTDRTWRTGAAGPDDCSNQGLSWTGTEAVVVCSISTVNESPARFVAYDPAADAWRDLPAPPVPYTEAVLAWTGDRLVAFGRTEPFSLPAGDGEATVYDPDAETWSEPVRLPVNAQASAITWTGEEVVVVDYDMDAAAFDPVTGEARDLPSVPLRFYECSPQAFTAAGQAVVSLCSGGAVLGADDRWTPFVGPDGTAPGWYGGTGGSAVFTTASTPSTPDEAPDERAGQPVAFLPAGLDDRTIPLGVSTFTTPEGAELTSVELLGDTGNEVVEATVELADGTTCTARSGYLTVFVADGVAQGEERVDVTTADGTVHDAAVGRATPGEVVVAWYWSADLGTDRQEATCPTLEQAVQLARSFGPPTPL